MHQFHIITEGVSSKTHCSEKTLSSRVNITKQNTDLLKALENIELLSFQAVNEMVMANIPSELQLDNKRAIFGIKLKPVMIERSLHPNMIILVTQWKCVATWVITWMRSKS